MKTPANSNDSRHRQPSDLPAPETRPWFLGRSPAAKQVDSVLTAKMNDMVRSAVSRAFATDLAEHEEHPQPSRTPGRGISEKTLSVSSELSLSDSSDRDHSLSPSREGINELWRRFRKYKDCLARNRLLEYYLPLVRYTAERIHTKLPDEVSVEDLYSAGALGLMDAVNAFDPGRNVKFETYCAARIRGSILDELRSLDWVPRLVRSRSRKLKEAVDRLESLLNRKPTERELADHMRLSLPAFRKLQRDASAVSLVSLSRKWFQTDSRRDVREIDILESKKSDDPRLIAQRKDVRELITHGLSRAERLIVMLYYFEEMTMREIGDTLDLSESRVSQMHSAILERLRLQLDRRQKELQTV